MFAGGIGEKAAMLRTRVVQQCKCLGFEMDEQMNSKNIRDVVQDIGREGARHRTLVSRTDEQVITVGFANHCLIANGLAVRNGKTVC